MNDDDEPSGPDYVPTVKIVGGAHGTIRINKKDYDPAIHTLAAPPVPVAPASLVPAKAAGLGTVGQPAGLGVPAEAGGAPAKVFVAQLEPGKFYIVDAAGAKLKAKGYPTEAEAWTATLTLGA